MISIPKVIGLVSCCFVLCSGLSNVAKQVVRLQRQTKWSGQSSRMKAGQLLSGKPVSRSRWAIRAMRFRFDRSEEWCPIRTQVVVPSLRVNVSLVRENLSRHVSSPVQPQEEER